VIIIRKIDIPLLLQIIRNVNSAGIIWAFLWFILSKIISALRYNTLLKTDGIHLTEKQNLRLYWVGMYYNLLLPGGISGDGYKIKVLMDNFNKTFTRLFAITLIDRFSGVIALCFICFILIPFTPVIHSFQWLSIPGIVLCSILLWVIFRWYGANLKFLLLKTTLQSLGVQLAQSLSALGLIYALDLQSNVAGYLMLFLCSSVVAMVPFTIGGAGARELTFLFGSSLLGLEAEKAVAIGFMFYLISCLVSLAGIFFSFKKGILTD
jgi:uncharacterized membrane protein YbhN (UPF0104 family)